MAHMTLPAAHSEADALLAEQIGRALELEEVHVFWTLPGPAGQPSQTASPASGGSPKPASAAGLIGLLSAVLGRLAPQRR